MKTLAEFKRTIHAGQHVTRSFYYDGNRPEYQTHYVFVEDGF